MRVKDVVKELSEVKLALLAVPVLAMIAGAVISWYVLPQVYKASTTLMVFKQPEIAAPYEVRINTIMLNQKLVKTYSELAKSETVLEEVIKKNNLKMTVDDLRQKVTVELLGDTELLRISVNSSNPTLSAMLANELARVLLEKVAELMNLDNIQVVDAASPPKRTVWPNITLNVLLAGVIGLLLVVGVAILRASIKSDYEDVAHLISQPAGSDQILVNQSEVKDKL